MIGQDRVLSKTTMIGKMLAVLAVLALRAGAFVAPRGPLRIPTQALHAQPKRLVQVVEQLGGKVTAGDVAGAGAADLVSAERELLALAARLGGEVSLEATEDGGLVFAFPKATAKALAAVDGKEKWLQRWEEVKPGVYTLGRTAFGVSLFVSLAVGAVAMQTLMAASSSDENRRDERRGGGFYFYPSIWGPSPFDIFYYRPYYGYGPPRPRREMNFLEAIYSYVFGDGDPNQDVTSRQIAAAAEIIRSNGGAVVAEQLAPVLAAPPSPPPLGRDPELAFGEEVVVDESYVLPVVSTLNGRATVDEDSGAIVYVFDELQSSGLALPPGAAAYDERFLAGDASGAIVKLDNGALGEYDTTFSRASQGQLVMAGALGAANLLLAGAVAFYSTVGLTPVVAARLGPAGVAGIRAVVWPLLAYSLTYNVLPLIRNYRLKRKNGEVSRRNAARAAWADVARRPTRKLREKLAAAKKLRPAVRNGGKVAYSTDADFMDVARGQETADLDDFDKLLR